MTFYKRRRSEAELQEIARTLAKGWTQGDPVAPHLRRTLPIISQMIHGEGVLIADIAQALDFVGIHYRTGPWNVTILKNELWKIKRGKKRQSRRITKPSNTILNGTPATPPHQINARSTESRHRASGGGRPAVAPPRPAAPAAAAATPPPPAPPARPAWAASVGHGDPRDISHPSPPEPDHDRPANPVLTQNGDPIEPKTPADDRPLVGLYGAPRPKRLSRLRSVFDPPETETED